MVSDIVTNGDLPAHVNRNHEFWASCVAGALEKREYLRLIRESGLEGTRILVERLLGGTPTKRSLELAGITVYDVKPRE